ncbi:MAG: DUF2461 domain-containing protein [Bacteroidota bacterium]
MSIIKTSTLDFLKKLEKNNDRDWFEKHKPTFKKEQIETKKSFEYLFNLMKQHDNVDDFKMFRIYRDVRFSKNKLPYKTHFAASFHRKKPELRGGYYIHIKPGDETFIATGFWNPEKNDLLRIRKEFEQDDEEIRAIISDKAFQNVWGNLEGDELKTAPRDFDKDHHAIDLIRKKQYIFTKQYKDDEVLRETFIDKVNESFRAVRPFFDYMSDVLTTNLNGESLI